MIDIFSSIDPNTMVLGLLFVIFFVLIRFALGRSLKDRVSSSVIAFCVSLLIVYGIGRTDFDISGMFYGIGITEEILYTIVPFIILAGLIFMIWKLKLSRTFILTGIFLIVAGFFSYEKTIVMIIGIALFALGIFILFWLKNRNPKNPPR